MGVRWDAVVQDSDFWSERVPPSPDVPLADIERLVCVQVWLFGSLNDGVIKSPISVQVRAPFSARDVIAELGRIHGRAFLGRVSDPDGSLFRNCRVYVNGQAVDDTTKRIRIGALRAEVELLLLTAAEGG